MFDYGEFPRMARFSRIGKIQKLIKVMKLFRLVKTVKLRNKMTRHLREIIKISVGIERIVMMLITFMIL
jgi:Ion transport protein